MHNKAKPNNYMESCGIDVADGWRERSVWYPGRYARYALKEVTTAKSSAERAEVSRGYSVRLESRYFNCRNAATSFS